MVGSISSRDVPFQDVGRPLDGLETQPLLATSSTQYIRPRPKQNSDTFPLIIDVPTVLFKLTAEPDRFSLFVNNQRNFPIKLSIPTYLDTSNIRIIIFSTRFAMFGTIRQ